MATLKTQKNDASVTSFLQSVQDDTRRKDSLFLAKMMQEITGHPPAMWGPGIVGFGSYHYRYESGREGDWFLTGFSPRKQNLVLYIMAGFARYQTLMDQLGKYKTGKACLYIKKLADVDEATLRQLIRESVAHMKETYPS